MKTFSAIKRTKPILLGKFKTTFSLLKFNAMKRLITLLLLFSFFIKNETIAQDCEPATAQAELTANKVRARLLNGGDMWWDTDDGQYLVPYNGPNRGTPSSLFAGGIWMGGLDSGGNLKLAAKTYGSSQGQTDYYPGPLDQITGSTIPNACLDWDRFFKVYKTEIEEHFDLLEKKSIGEINYTADMMPEGLKHWPAKGNPHFEARYGFQLPDTPQGLADFWDENGDGIYNPLEGDYPAFFQRDCNEPVIPDEMIFWIFNDAGGTHSESGGNAMKMEFQVTAFAFDRDDAFDYATFYKYKLVNRAVEDLVDAYFGLWVDPDLGCYTDDYIGCDTTRNMWYLYNQDALDGINGCSCPQGVNTYCEEVPMVGMDILRGPTDQSGNELGMSSFAYYNGMNINNPPVQDPVQDNEFYNFLLGKWRDGSRIQFGGTGFNTGGEETNFAFPSSPDCNDPSCWSTCSAQLGVYDRRIIQSVGPMQFKPGSVNELILGVVWTPDVPLPCPSLDLLGADDDFIQAAFDNCLQFQETPDAPEIEWIVGDQTLTGNLTNDRNSNNFEEGFNAVDIIAPDMIPTNDRTYKFEGYKVFQVINDEVNWDHLENPDKARLVFQTDIENGIGEIINWSLDANGDWISAAQVLSSNPDVGLDLDFEITADAFGGVLENEETYHFVALAYAYNDWQTFDPSASIGQRTPYLPSKIKHFSATPTAIVIPPDNGLGTVSKITRLDGVGAGSRFLDICQETEDKILDGSFDGKIGYNGERAPFEIRVTDPDNLSKDRFELTFIDEELNNQRLEGEIQWQLTNLDDPMQVYVSEILDANKISVADFPQYGFSIILNNGFEPGNNVQNLGDPRNGAIGFEKKYKNSAGDKWYKGIPDSIGIYDFVSTHALGPDNDLDPDRALSRLGDGWFVPYYLCDYRDTPTRPTPYITPVWTGQGNLVRQSIKNEELNNVDIVFTSDKSKWSRCIIVETSQPTITDFGFRTESLDGTPRNHFDTRGAPSVGKEDLDGDGLPDPDGDGFGMGWFPGYAIDVETGQRLNIFFGEASVYRCDEPFFRDFLNACGNDYFDNNNPTGADMMWNPTSQFKIDSVPAGTEGIWQAMTGGLHHIYVTSQEYDECADLRNGFRPGINPLFKARAFSDVTWTGIPILQEGQTLNSYADGLIPNEVKMKIRVDNPFEVFKGTGGNNNYPTYIFNMEDFVSGTDDRPVAVSPLKEVLLSPNPFSKRTESELRIQHLPRRSSIKVFDINGKQIANLGQAENESLTWSPPSSLAEGIYFVEVRNEEFGKRVLKWIFTK